MLAILTALATNTHSALIDYLAISHIVSRILYNLLYLFNISTLRSLIWFIATGCSFSIL
ncbi:MAG: MAPEG family protein, partial [Halieaceae bacterium]|nr:MAPEG family protein [Halieaceae bacterium]